tara:strand:+ start:1340 stop:1906 length:567 start_codon:yes stop_codon:yes gene_type:complete
MSHNFEQKEIDMMNYEMLMSLEAEPEYQCALTEAYNNMINHQQSMKDTDEWEYIFQNDNSISFGDHGFNESHECHCLDIHEMNGDMDVFEAEENRHNLLSVPHEHRPEDIKTCGKNILTTQDNINTSMKLHCHGQNYWTGYSKDFGKIYIPINLVHLVNQYPDVDMDVSMKYMGPHCMLPWRAFYIHK